MRKGFFAEMPLSWMNPVLEIKSEGQTKEKLYDPIATGRYLGEVHKLRSQDPDDQYRAIDLAAGFTANVYGHLRYLENIPGRKPKSYTEERVCSFLHKCPSYGPQGKARNRCTL